MKVVICTPTRDLPHSAYVDAMEASAPVLEAAGIDFNFVLEIACPYISAARATMLRKALDAGADAIVFIDDDLSWEPSDLLKLVQTPGEVVAGLYRFKKDEPEFMGSLATDGAHRPSGRFAEGTRTLVLRARQIPGGFMKITREGVARFMRAYPQLSYGDPIAPHVDLFNHGAHNGVWFGEDYAFSRNWIDAGGDLWVIPDLTLTHHGPATAYSGNFHEFLLSQPGGVNDPAAAQQSAA